MRASTVVLWWRHHNSCSTTTAKAFRVEGSRVRPRPSMDQNNHINACSARYFNHSSAVDAEQGSASKLHPPLCYSPGTLSVCHGNSYRCLQHQQQRGVVTSALARSASLHDHHAISSSRPAAAAPLPPPPPPAPPAISSRSASSSSPSAITSQQQAPSRSRSGGNNKYVNGDVSGIKRSYGDDDVISNNSNTITTTIGSLIENKRYSRFKVATDLDASLQSIYALVYSDPTAFQRYYRNVTNQLQVAEQCGVQISASEYTTAAYIYIACRRYFEALSIICKMRQADIEPPLDLYDKLTSLCQREGKQELLEEVTRMKELKIAVDDAMGVHINRKQPTATADVTVRCAKAIDTCARLGGAKEALALLQWMRQKGIIPHVDVYLNAILACRGGEDYQGALATLEEVNSTIATPSRGCYIATMDVCAEAGRLQAVVELLEEMRSKGLDPGTRSYRAVIVACGRQGECSQALDVMNVMEEVGVTPDRSIFHAALDACAVSGQYAAALSLLRDMRAIGDDCQPDVQTYNRLLVMCARSGAHKQALQLLANMKKAKVTPDKDSYFSVIQACTAAGDHSTALKVVYRLREL